MRKARLIHELFDLRGNDEQTFKKLFISDENRDLTYGEFFDAVNYTASGILSNLIRNSYDRIMIEMENDIDSFIKFISVVMLGGIAVPIPRGMSKDAMEKMALDCNPVGIIVKDLDIYKSLNDKRIMSIPIIIPKKGISPCSALDRTVLDIDPAMILYTSGSTGMRKGVVCSHENVIAATESIVEYLNLDEEDVIIDFLPPTFDYGLYQFILAAMVGARVILRKRFLFADEVIMDIAQSSATVFPLVPTMASRLAICCDSKDMLLSARASSIRVITSTGAALHEDLVCSLENLFGAIKIFSMYGLTECKRVSFLDPNLIHVKPDSVGKPMPNVSVRIVGDDGKDLPPYSVGNLMIRGRNIAMGYWSKETIDDTSIIKNKLGQRELVTGDYFSMDEEGFLYFIGRKDDLVKSCGYRISLIEIERALMSLGYFIDVAVKAFYNEHGDAVINAFVIPKESEFFSERMIKRDLVAYFGASAYVPSHIYAVGSIDANENGKHKR